MNKVFSWLAVAVLALLALPARAQDLVSEAEEAYSAVDFDRTLLLSERALHSGSLSPVRLARVYELMGIARAASGDDEGAREAFKRLLALSPDATADANLSPRLRSPFMEAGGFWESRRTRLAVEATVVRSADAIRVSTADPLAMGHHIVVRSRRMGENEWHEESGDVGEGVRVPLAAREEAQIEYCVVLVDEFGNRLVELGTMDEPLVFGTAPTVLARPDEPVEPAPTGMSAGGKAGVVLVVLAAVAGAAFATYYFAFRPVELDSRVAFE